MNEEDDGKKWEHRMVKAMAMVCGVMILLCALVIWHIFVPK